MGNTEAHWKSKVSRIYEKRKVLCSVFIFTVSCFIYIYIRSVLIIHIKSLTNYYNLYVYQIFFTYFRRYSEYFSIYFVISFFNLLFVLIFRLLYTEVTWASNWEETKPHSKELKKLNYLNVKHTSGKRSVSNSKNTKNFSSC